MVYRASDEASVVFREELQRIAARRRARLAILTGRRSALEADPLSAAALRTALPDIAGHDVYLCGPTGMTGAVKKALRQAGVPRRQIHHETFEF